MSGVRQCGLALFFVLLSAMLPSVATAQQHGQEVQSEMLAEVTVTAERINEYAGRGWHRQELPVAEGQEVFIEVVLSEHQPICPTSTNGRSQISSFQHGSPNRREPGLRACKPTFLLFWICCKC
jgi:hypothetical protein